MTASTIESAVRAPLKAALSGVTATVYEAVPENPIVPFVTLVPDSPYLELSLINKSTFKSKVHLALSCGVAYNSNLPSLDNLEQLLISVVTSIPAGYEITSIEKPTVLEVGASTLLVADIRVSTYYTQTN